MRIEIWRASDGKPIASVGSWEAAWAVERLMCVGVEPIPGTNLVWTGLVMMAQPRKNVLLIDINVPA